MLCTFFFGSETASVCPLSSDSPQLDANGDGETTNGQISSSRGINLTPLLLCVDNDGVRFKHTCQDDPPEITLRFPAYAFMPGNCQIPRGEGPLTLPNYS